MSFHDSQMPPDPFADDPNDPASFLEPEEEVPPLTPDHREALLTDLRDLHAFQQHLAPCGIRGVVLMCDDCDEVHYYDWQIIENNIMTLLGGGRVPVHEPSVQPDPTRYVSWDYCLGFADAMDERARRNRKNTPWTPPEGWPQ